jgi:flagellar hook assembly protein FlgD
MSILGTTANYTVTIQATPAADDPFELVQGAHFMQLLLAQMRPRNPQDKSKRRDGIEQLARINLLQEIDEAIEPANATSPAGKTSTTPAEKD